MCRGLGPDEKKARRDVYELFWDNIVGYITSGATSQADLLTRLGTLVSDARDVGYEPVKRQAGLEVKGIPIEDIERIG